MDKKIIISKLADAIENSKRETLILTIDAENESSATSKILQVFSLGRIPSGSSNVVP